MRDTASQSRTRNFSCKENRDHASQVPSCGTRQRFCVAKHGGNSSSCCFRCSPFDRTIKVSLTERLTKEQISARMPHNLKTLDYLMQENRHDFRVIVSKSATEAEKERAKRTYQRRRLKSLVLVEELSLRSRRVIPLMRQLEQYSQRMDYLQSRIAQLKQSGANALELNRNIAELRHLILTTQRVHDHFAIDVKSFDAISKNTKQSRDSFRAETYVWWSRLLRSTAIVV